MCALAAKVVQYGPVARPQIEEPASVQDSLGQTRAVVVFAGQVVDPGQDKLLEHARSRMAFPFERVLNLCLVLSVNRHGVVRSRAAEEVAPVRGAVVNEGPRVDEQFLSAREQHQGESVGMPMPAVEHPESAAIEHKVAAARSPIGPLYEVT